MPSASRSFRPTSSVGAGGGWSTVTSSGVRVWAVGRARAGWHALDRAGPAIHARGSGPVKVRTRTADDPCTSAMEPTASRPAPSGPIPDADALATLLDCEADLDALERVLMAVAVHPAGAGAARAWWLLWDERRGVLEERRKASPRDADASLAAAMARARRAPPAARSGASAKPSWARPADALAGVCVEAWRTGLPAHGETGVSTDAPWSACAQIAAVPLRRGAASHALMVLGFEGAGPSEGALAWLATAGNAALAAQVRAADSRRRARQVAGFAEFARLAVSAANLAETSHALVRLAAQSLQVAHAAFYRARPDGALALELSHGAAPTREPQARALQPAAAEVARAQRTLSGSGPDELPGPAMEGTGEVTAWAFQPVLAYGRVLGVLAAWDGAERHASTPGWERGDVDVLAAFADHAALLFEHAR